MLVLLSSCRLRRLLSLLMLGAVVFGLSPAVRASNSIDPMVRLAADLAVLCSSNGDDTPHTPDGLPCAQCPECLPVGLLAAPPPNPPTLHRPDRLTKLLHTLAYAEPIHAAYPPRPLGQGPPHTL